MESPAAAGVRTLVLLVTAALDAGEDPVAAVQAAVRPAPSANVVRAVIGLIEAVRTPGMSAREILACIEAQNKL
ncbi:hypothetical protein [Nocardia yamanashiensis]|uniref:hypothetical protein n=1 Tax=Nocardia yamanashiensis TaxID=209247 RepID=UPI00083102AA|nr:hypothetical protein [Nocardia yamanashiensis]